MSHNTARVAFTLVLVLVVLLGPVGRGAVRAEGVERLPAGDDVRQFVLVGIGPESVAIVDGEVRLTGKPDGYFATRASYKNYVLRFEWKYDRPEGLASDAAFRGNSGVLLHVDGPHKVWPTCIESQLMNADAGHLFAVPKARFRGSHDADAQKRAVKPVGEWNLHEVTCKDGAIVCTLNGVEVSRGAGASPDHGAIAWQSEGAPVRFRAITITPTD